MTRPAGVRAIAIARRRRFPTVYYLRQHARRRIPKFGFDATDGGAGTDGGIARNAAALDAIELMPRYGVDDGSCHMEVELFGRRYAAPFGVAPMGMPGIVWPGAEKYLAKAAQRARIPYTAGTVASSTVEELAELADDMLWFQLYRMAQDDHRYGFDLVQARAGGRCARARRSRWTFRCAPSGRAKFGAASCCRSRWMRARSGTSSRTRPG